MELSSIGKHIREQRIRKNWKQEQLAEKTELSVVYIGMIERGEKLPKLETFIKLLNVLEVPADEVLEDVLNTGYSARTGCYTEKFEKLERLSHKDRKHIMQMIDIMAEEP